MKKALIAGITGQDGSYLAEFLLDKNYEVHGVIRAASTDNTRNIKHIMDKIHLHKGDLGDPLSIYRIIDKVRPQEIYNEADQDHVSWSFDTASYSYDITGSAVGRFLEMIKDIYPKIKFFQPVSSNIFGDVGNQSELQTEETALNPTSPYGIAKAMAYISTRSYRNHKGLFASTGIFYNHESERRSEKYVTRKISGTIARINAGLEKKLFLGDINMKIDWGYAKEYMEAAWNIMQLDKPGDFIICTGENHSIREFVDEGFKHIGIKLVWKEEGVNEVGYDQKTGREYVGINPKFFRPSKTSPLLGDISKAKKAFGFEPKIKFKEIVKKLVEHDIKEVKKLDNERNR